MNRNGAKPKMATQEERDQAHNSEAFMNGYKGPILKALFEVHCPKCDTILGPAFTAKDAWALYRRHNEKSHGGKKQ